GLLQLEPAPQQAADGRRDRRPGEQPRRQGQLDQGHAHRAGPALPEHRRLLVLRHPERQRARQRVVAAVLTRGLPGVDRHGPRPLLQPQRHAAAPYGTASTGTPPPGPPGQPPGPPGQPPGPPGQPPGPPGQPPGPPATTPPSGPGDQTAAVPQGYWMLGSDSKVYPFGAAKGFGDGPAGVAAVDLEPTPSGQGYWVLSADG